MAINQQFNNGVQFDVPAAAVTAPAEPASSTPVLVGQLPAVALTDPYEAGDGTMRITIKTDGVYHFDVAASDGAIEIGHIVHIATATGVLSNTSGGGVRFGYALAPVDSTATANIPVKIGH
jgi:predicted RecA/RadA family phage recombinase